MVYKKYKKFLLIVSFSFILNLIWEFSHFVLYIDLSGIPKNLHLIQASFMDMLIISAIFLIISLKNKNLNWTKKPKRIDYLIIVVLGIIVAGGIEFWALSVGRWMYKDLMPTIFGIGLSPLIQLFSTGILSLIIFRIILYKNR